MELQEFREFVKNEEWIFSKTYANNAPHEYIVREKIKGSDDEFVGVVILIREKGFKAKFWGREHIYLPVDNKFYWTMGDPIDETIILNRCNQKDYELIMRFNNANL